jgi:hypothetical protein
MKNRIAALVLCMVFISLGDVVTLPRNCWLNFMTKDTVTGSSPCSGTANSSHDFFWAYYDHCTCLCPCCPYITVGSPRPFYISKRPMNGDELKSMGAGGQAQLQDTTLFEKCSTATGLSPFGVGCGQFNCTGQSAQDTLCSRLFVIQMMGGIMRVKINAIYSHSPQCPYNFSEAIDSIKIAYGISTPVEPLTSARPTVAPVNPVTSAGLTTVSGRAVRGPVLSRGTYIMGKKKTVRINGTKKEKMESQILK